MIPKGLSRRQLKTRLARIAHHPLVAVVTGVGLLTAGIMEAAEEIFVGYEGLFEIYHAAILLGVATLLKAIADAVEGLEWLSKDEEDEAREAKEAV